ncbi:hypothetical protein AMTRI_Chr07g81050 [Amborella trichopoda]
MKKIDQNTLETFRRNQVHLLKWDGCNFSKIFILSQTRYTMNCPIKINCFTEMHLIKILKQLFKKQNLTKMPLKFLGCSLSFSASMFSLLCFFLQAEILEKKRLKKLRQRELKAKDQADIDKVAEGFSEEGSTDPLDMISSSSPGSTANPGLPSLSDLTNEHQVAPPRRPISRAGPRFRGYSRAPPPSCGHLVWAPKVNPDHVGLCTDERGVCRSSEGFFVDDRAVHRSKEGTCMDRKVACRSYEGSCGDKGAVHGEEGSCMEERVMHGSDEGSSMDDRAVHEKDGSSMDERIGHGNNMVSFMNERVWHGDDNRSCMDEKAVCRGDEGLQKDESMVHRDNDERCEVLIGSISVVLGGAQVTAKKSGLGQNGISRPVMKLWRPVGLGPKNGGPGKGVFSSQLLEAFLSERSVWLPGLDSPGDRLILELTSPGIGRSLGVVCCLDNA